jgi:hypothetical protein
MNWIRQILLLVLFAFASVGVKAQNDADQLVQHLQTANFNKLLSFWDTQVEVNLPDLAGQKQFSPVDANEMLRSFYSRNNIIGFEKNAERKVGTTIYLTGKLLSQNAKYNLTLLMQENKQHLTIVSVRVS